MQRLEVGDRVGNLEGQEGTVSRLCADEEVVMVQWDGGMQEMMDVKDLKKLEVKNAGDK